MLESCGAGSSPARSGIAVSSFYRGGTKNEENGSARYGSAGRARRKRTRSVYDGLYIRTHPPVAAAGRRIALSPFLSFFLILPYRRWWMWRMRRYRRALPERRAACGRNGVAAAPFRRPGLSLSVLFTLSSIYIFLSLSFHVHIFINVSCTRTNHAYTFFVFASELH